MIYEPSILRDAVVLLLVMLSSGGCGLAFGWFFGRRVAFQQGHRAGVNEERTHANARVAVAKIQAFRKGVCHATAKNNPQ